MFPPVNSELLASLQSLCGIRVNAHPGEANSLRRKDSRKVNVLAQILIAKLFDFGGICS